MSYSSAGIACVDGQLDTITLVQHACRMAIDGIQESTDDVGPRCQHIVCWHKVEGQKSKKNPCVTYEAINRTSMPVIKPKDQVLFIWK